MPYEKPALRTFPNVSYDKKLILLQCVSLYPLTWILIYVGVCLYKILFAFAGISKILESMTIREIYNSPIEGEFSASQTVQGLESVKTKRMADIISEPFPGSITEQARIPVLSGLLHENDVLKTKPAVTYKQRINGHKRSCSETLHARSTPKKPDMDFQHDKKWASKFYESFEDPPILTSILTYISFLILILVGHIREFLKKLGIGRVKNISEPNIPVNLYSLSLSLSLSLSALQKF